MITLIKNVKVYRDGEWKNTEILITGSLIEKIDEVL